VNSLVQECVATKLCQNMYLGIIGTFNSLVITVRTRQYQIPHWNLQLLSLLHSQTRIPTI